MDYNILYKSPISIWLEGYRNANGPAYKADQQSISNFVFLIDSGAMSWSSKKLLTVALSSSTDEYKSMVVATCEVVWLKRILKDLDVSINDRILLNYNNLNSIHLARNSQTKQIEVHYQFIRERILAGDVDLQHINTNL